MAANKKEEVAALETLRDSSASLVKYLNGINGQLTKLNQQNETALRVLENWHSVIDLTKAASSRVNGFQPPLSRDQVTSWVLQPVLMLSFILLAVQLLDPNKAIPVLIADAVLILIILLNWTICETRNPADSTYKSRWKLSCLKIPKKETRYCSLCSKTSYGLDHHCTWLNTCIGENNYEAFYCLVITATCQTLLQTVVGICIGTIWWSECAASISPDWKTTICLLLWLHNAIALVVFTSYAMLSGFHTYLLVIGCGTYDFILATGDDGLCVRMLRCGCFGWCRRKLKHMKQKKGDLKKRVVKEAISARNTRGDSIKVIPKLGPPVSLTPMPSQQFEAHQAPKGAIPNVDASNRNSANAKEERSAVSEVSVPVVFSCQGEELDDDRQGLYLEQEEAMHESK